MYLKFNNILAKHENYLLPAEYKEVEYVYTNGGNAVAYVEPVDNMKNLYVKLGIMKTNTETAEQGFFGIGSFLELYFLNGKINDYLSISLISPVSGSPVEPNTKIDVVALMQPHAVRGTSVLIGQYRINRFTFYGNIYYAQIIDANSGNMLLDFVPCRRVSDDVVGFYDRVTGLFYQNVGSGTFVAGPDK